MDPLILEDGVVGLEHTTGDIHGTRFQGQLQEGKTINFVT
jgi:hypothetical protein